MNIVFILDNITQAAKQLITFAGDKRIVALHGQMGAGKTTLVHAVCEVLAVQDVVSSPTFSIINEYGTASGNMVYHIDLYRLANEREAVQAGVEECIFSGEWCFVEWPEKAPGLFPQDIMHCYLTVKNSNEREMKLY